MAVILALTIDPSRALGADEDAGSGAVPDAAPPAAPSSRRGRERARRGWGWGSGLRAEEDLGSATRRRRGRASSFPLHLFATALSDTGTSPRTALGFGGGLGYDARLLHVEAALAYWPTVRSEVATPGAGGSFSMLAADLRACFLAQAGVFAFGPCAGVGLTRMRAEGFGVADPDRGRGGELGSARRRRMLVRARVSRFFSPRLSLGATVPLSRPVFEVEGLGPVHQPAAIALQIALGMEIHF